MYIRMVFGTLRPGSWDEYEHHYRERVAGSPNQVKGLRQRQLLRSSEDPDEGMSLSVWDTLEDLVNYERGEFRS